MRQILFLSLLSAPLEQPHRTDWYNGFDRRNEVTSIAEQMGVREIANILK